MSDIDGDFVRAAWPEGYQVGTEISPYQPYGGLDEYGNLVSWEDQFEAQAMAEMLRRDGKARSLENILTLPVQAHRLAISGAKGDKGELDWLLGMYEGMSSGLEQIVAWGAQSFIFRSTFLEKVFAVSEGKVIYQQLAWRPPEACSLIHDKLTGSILGFQQMLGGPDRFGLVEVPLRKAAVFVHGRNRNPMRGSSDLEVALRCYGDKQKVRYLWMTFLDSAAMPRTIASTDAGKEAEVTSTLSKLRSGGTASVPSGTDVKALDVAGTAAPSFQAALNYLDAEMATSVLAGFADLASAAGSGSRGSLTMAQSETTWFANALDASAREVAATLRTQVSAPLLRANFGPDAAVPSHVIGPISPLSAEDAMTALQMMAWANATNSLIPTEFVEELVMRTADMLELPTDKLRAAIATKEKQLAAAATPAALPTVPIHAGVSVTHNAVRQAMAGKPPPGAPAQSKAGEGAPNHNAMRRAMTGRGPMAGG